MIATLTRASSPGPMEVTAPGHMSVTISLSHASDCHVAGVRVTVTWAVAGTRLSRARDCHVPPGLQCAACA